MNNNTIKDSGIPWVPVVSESGNISAYRVEDDNSLSVQFRGEKGYNFAEADDKDIEEFIRRAPTDESNGSFFAATIKKTKGVPIA